MTVRIVVIGPVALVLDERGVTIGSVQMSAPLLARLGGRTSARVRAAIVDGSLEIEEVVDGR